jgi:hypothetical protein
MIGHLLDTPRISFGFHLINLKGGYELQWPNTLKFSKTMKSTVFFVVSWMTIP